MEIDAPEPRAFGSADTDARMHSSVSAEAVGSSAASAAAASPASAHPSDWRPAVRHEYESSSISAQHPIAARRFDTCTPQHYSQHYAQRTAQHDHGVPIVFDNGSYELRAGFSTDADPRLCFRSLVGRPRMRKEADFVLVGNQLVEGDQYIPQRMKVRSPFEQMLVTQFDLMEYLFDYSFHALGLTSSIPHPVFLTEPLANPNYCRGKMSELLLECYGVEGVGYGLAEVASWRYNVEQDKRDGDVTGDALVISCGYESSTVVPIIDSKPSFAHSTRLSVGGAQLSTHLTHALLHVEHPQHQAQFNAHRVQQLVEQYCEVVPESYDEVLSQMALLYDVNSHAVPDGVPSSSGLPPPVILQLPFVPSTTVNGLPSAAELASRAEKKELQRQRLKQLMAERKEKKLAEDQEILADWEAVRADFHAKLLTPSEFLRQLKRRTFESEAEFAQHYEKMKLSVAARLRGETVEEAERAASEAAWAAQQSKSEQELYPLLFRLDTELSAEELKEKARQKRLRQAAEQQAVRRRDRELKLQREAQMKEQEAAEYAADPAAFVASLQRAREAIVAAREERIKAEADGSSGVGGRRSAAARKRASLLAAMGGSGGSIESIEKMARKDRAAFQREASFGMNDADWKVYEEVRLPGGADAAGQNESDDERDALAKVESKLAQYAPDSLAALIAPVAAAPAREEDFRVPLWIDRVRLPEMMFQPAALLGVDEAGLGEMLARTLHSIGESAAKSVVNNVLLTGGSTLFPNFRERITYELRQLRPVGSALRVRHARDPLCDAWRGAASFCNSSPFASIFLTRAQWDERGFEYLKEHGLSNAFVPTPSEEAVEAAKRRKRQM